MICHNSVTVTVSVNGIVQSPVTLTVIMPTACDMRLFLLGVNISGPLYMFFLNGHYESSCKWYIGWLKSIACCVEEDH